MIVFQFEAKLAMYVFLYDGLFVIKLPTLGNFNIYKPLIQTACVSVHMGYLCRNAAINSDINTII